VGKVMSVLALSFLLIPFGTVTMAWVRRNLEFRKILFVRIATALVGSTTSVLLAFAGYSYMSMAWGLLAGSIVTIVIAQLPPARLAVAPIVPERAEVFRFGTWSTGTAITSQLTGSVQDLVVGRMISMDAVGYFWPRRRRHRDRLSRVRVGRVRSRHPFAAKDRAGADVAQGFCTTVRYLTVLIWPALAGIAIPRRSSSCCSTAANGCRRST
jgi:hypothetical protein